jgi:hypothetical protein
MEKTGSRLAGKADVSFVEVCIFRLTRLAEQEE